MFGGQVGVKDHVRIGNGVQVAGQSGVHNDVEDGKVLGGAPAEDIRAYFRQIAAIKKLPEFARELKALTKKIDALCQNKKP